MRHGARVFGPVAPGLTTRVLADLFCTPRPRPLDDGQRTALSRGERFTIDHEGGRLDAWSYGEGPAVLLVHGWAGRGAQLHHFIEPLVARGRRVVLFDAPAHGASDGSTTNLGDFARSVAAALGSVDDVEAIIAHSMGGASTAVALARFIEGPGRLVFIAPPVHPSAWIARFQEMIDLSDELTARLTAEVERRARIPLDEVHATDIAPSMSARLLVIHDRDDREVPYDSGRTIAGAWPRAELLTTEGLGHNRILRDSEVIDAAVRFVAGYQSKESQENQENQENQGNRS